MTSNNNILFTYGQTGSGKTRKILNEVISYLENEETHHKVIVCAFGNRHSVECVFQDLNDYFDEKFDKKTALKIKRLFMQYVSGAKESFILAKYCQCKHIEKNFILPKVIFTTHAYLTTRGDSFILYPLQVDLLWIRKNLKLNVELLVDESHLYYDSLVWSFKIKGMYHKVDGLNNTEFLKPIRIVDSSQHDGPIEELITEHIYEICPISKNPKIFWDKKTSDLKYKFPKVNKNKDIINIPYLDYRYTYIPNSSYKLKQLKNIEFQFILPKSTQRDILRDLSSILESLNVKLTTVRNTTYNSVVDLYLNTTPYFIERATDKNFSHDKQPGTEIISGYHLYPLYLINSIFSSIICYSASLTDYHKNMWNYLGIDVKQITLSSNNKNQGDFGAIFLNGSGMTSNLLDQIRQSLGNVIHFSHTIIDSKSLESNLSKNSKTKYNYVKYDKSYRTEIITSRNPSTPLVSMTDTNNTKMYLSYWGSSLSNGVNLDYLNICSVDLKYAIPFIFLPMKSHNNFNFDLKFYILDFLTENLKQMLSRVCRGKNNAFKILILNRFKTKQMGHELVSHMIKDMHFLDKFKSFKIYYMIGFNQIELSYMGYLLNKRYNELFNFYLNDPENMLDDLINYVRLLEPNQQKSLIQNLSSKYKKLKDMLKQNLVTNETTLTNGLDTLTPIAFTVNISESAGYFSFLNLKNQEFKEIVLCLNDSLEKIHSFLTAFLNPKILLVEFTSNNNHISILSYLCKQSEMTTFGSIKNWCGIILNSDKPGHTLISKRIFYNVNLKIMCGKVEKSNKFSLDNIAVYLNYKVIPSSVNCSEMGYHQCNIINILYNQFFSINNLKLFDTYCGFLLTKFSSNPFLKQKISSYCKTPEKKWSILYNDVLNIINKPIRSKLYLLCTSLIIKIFNKQSWNDSNLKEQLNSYFSNRFYFPIGKRGKFRDKFDNELMLPLNFHGQNITLGSGGLRSKDDNTYIISNKNNLLYDVDITGFYGNILYIYNLTTFNRGLNTFFKTLVEERTKAQIEQNQILDQCLKFIINSVSGNLANQNSTLFNPQCRFDLICLSHLLMLNLLDSLKHHNLSVWAVRTDGFLLRLHNESQKSILLDWGLKFDLKLKMKKLNWFSIKSSVVTKSFSNNNDVEMDGLKYDIDNITSSTSFTRTKPLIWLDILKNPKLPHIKSELNIKTLGLFIMAFKDNSKVKYILEKDTQPIETEIIRFVLGKKTPYTLYKKTLRNKVMVFDNIIPMNILEPISKNSVCLNRYFDLLKSKLSSENIFNNSISVVNQNSLSKNENIICRFDFKQIQSSIYNFFNKYKKLYKFTPKISGGNNFGLNLKGKLSSNAIDLLEKNHNYCGLAVFIATDFFVIDIDDNESIPKNFKIWLKNNLDQICISYHSDKEINLCDVIDKKRFKLFFKSTPGTISWLQNIKQPLMSLKIEVLYNTNNILKQAVTVDGLHKSGNSLYFMKGGISFDNLEPIKKPIYIFLNNMSIEASKSMLINTSKSVKNIQEHYILHNIKSKTIENIIKNLVKEKGGGKNYNPENLTLRYAGSCPNSHLHTSPSSANDFSIKYWYKTETLAASCYHSSCNKANLAWCNKLFNKTNEQREYDKKKQSTSDPILIKLSLKQQKLYLETKSKLETEINKSESNSSIINSLRSKITYWKNLANFSKSDMTKEYNMNFEGMSNKEKIKLVNSYIKIEQAKKDNKNPIYINKWRSSIKSWKK